MKIFSSSSMWGNPFNPNSLLLVRWESSPENFSSMEEWSRATENTNRDRRTQEKTHILLVSSVFSGDTQFQCSVQFQNWRTNCLSHFRSHRYFPFLLPFLTYSVFFLLNNRVAHFSSLSTPYNECGNFLLPFYPIPIIRRQPDCYQSDVFIRYRFARFAWTPINLPSWEGKPEMTLSCEGFAYVLPSFLHRLNTQCLSRFECTQQPCHVFDVIVFLSCLCLMLFNYSN